MTFKPGISGNPTGRPKGAVSKRLQLSKLLEPHAKELIEKAVELAKSGEVNALRLCIERIIPKSKDESVQIELPENTRQNLNRAETLLELGAQIIQAVADGVITPEQGETFTNVLEAQRKNIEIADLSIRISEIENTLRRRPKHDK